jgi:hypothetical protein
MSRANESVYPQAETDRFPAEPGLTIREHFAAMALQGMLANQLTGMAAAKVRREESMEMLARDAVGHADALIAELSK